MPRPPHLTILASLVLIAGCGGSGDPPSSPPPGGSGDAITGRERIGWTQRADSPSDLALYSYVLYVDQSRRPLEGVTCAAAAADAVDCSAPLPSLTTGAHALEIAAAVTDAAGTMVEGARSAVLRVTVTGLTAPGSAEDIEGGAFLSSDGVQLRAEILARNLVDPVDVAAAPDGRVFVAEGDGQVRVVERDGSRSTVALTERDLRAVSRGAEIRLASIALAPDFAASGLLHLASIAVTGEDAVLQITRLRELDGRLAQAATIGTHPVSADATVISRFGPDGMLYLGVGAGANHAGAQLLARASGKILRLREDGGTPAGNPWSTPLFSLGHHDPRGLAWLGAGDQLWEVEREGSGDEINAVRAGANYGWPLVRGREHHPRVTSPALSLPLGAEVSGVAVVTAPGSPLAGDLIVAALGAEDLIRVRPGAQAGAAIVGHLLQRRFGRIAQVASDRQGLLYVVTANSARWGAGRDMLIRISLDTSGES